MTSTLTDRCDRLPNERLRNAHLIFTGCLLGFVILCIQAFSQGSQGVSAARHLTVVEPQLDSDAPSAAEINSQMLSLAIKFDQFAARTKAEKELGKMLDGKDEDIDLAVANWLVAADVPQFANTTREAYFKQLDSMSEQVRQAMTRGGNADEPRARCSRFCHAILKLGLAYCEEFRQEELSPTQMKALHQDANNTFLAGPLRTRRGSCVSMPLIYLVIGQRLGLPVHLVNIGKHYFIRWEEPGFLINIEPTIVERVPVTPDDSVYLEIEGMSRAQVSGNQLRNLTRREVVGNLLFARSAYWAAQRPQFKRHQCLDLSRARHLAPDDPGIKATQQALFSFYGIKPERGFIKTQPR